MPQNISHKTTPQDTLLRYDLLHILYSGMLLNFSFDSIRSFWSQNMIPGYQSTDEYFMFNELWQGKKWYPKEYVFSVLNNFEQFLMDTNVDAFEFLNKTFHKINNGILISPRDWLVWSKSILELFFSKQDIRYLVLKLLNYYNSKIAHGVGYSIVQHSSENKVNTTTIMFSSTNPSLADFSLPKYNCELWSAYLVSNFPTAIQLEPFEKYVMLADHREISDITPDAILKNGKLYINNICIAEQTSFLDFCTKHSIEYRCTADQNDTVWIAITDYICPLRTKTIIHKGCVYGAPVYFFQYTYTPVQQTPRNFLEPLIDDIAHHKDNIWIEIKSIHKTFISNLHPKLSFVYDRKNETVFLDGAYVIKNVPAKILRKMLAIYTESGRAEFHHSEFVKDESIIENPLNPNFVVRLQRLTHALKVLNKGISIEKVDKGIFSLSTKYKIEYTECN